ncbi:hypothetical protein [Bacteroides cellulosilyticus]|uniref:hypothetical protein n=1 Tax=Bacteroides cellulosilyticus TaxID=246787 RepID=UPI00137817FC|nr:hypothetical protein [Bacteroides cellulosilyticus]
MVRTNRQTKRHRLQQTNNPTNVCLCTATAGYTNRQNNRETGTDLSVATVRTANKRGFSRIITIIRRR